MEYRELGRSSIKVSSIALGTMTWGQQNTEAEAHEQMDYALERDINFFDAAEMYPVPPKAETYGRTEEYIGTWFKQRGKRDRVVLATKAISRGDFDYIRGGPDCRLNTSNKPVKPAYADCRLTTSTCINCTGLIAAPTSLASLGFRGWMQTKRL